MTPNIIPHRKEFLAGLAGMGGGPTGLALGGAVAKRTYLDDVYSLQLYTGNGSARTMPIGIDMSTDGGLIITKTLQTDDWAWGSSTTSLGTGKYIPSNSINQRQNDAQSYTAFNSNGYSIGNANVVNNASRRYMGYSFKKIPGFLDIVEYTGNAANSRDISHNLGSTPGWIITMCATKSENKPAWHRGFDDAKWIPIDGTGQESSGNNAFPQKPTNTQFTIGSYNNLSGETYVAWIFAGGESNAATAKSVEFDGSGDYLATWDDANAGLSSGTGDFTFEAWVRSNQGTSGSSQCIYDNRSGTGSNSTGFFLGRMSAHAGRVELYTAGDYRCIDGVRFSESVWNHVAVVRQSNVIKLYVNGVQSGSSYSVSDNYSHASAKIGGSTSNQDLWQGDISNARFVNGTAVYTSEFKPPIEPLTNITNTKLLCCNGDTPTSKTVGPTLLSGGNPTATTDSPFSDPAEYVFGDDGKQNLISTGSYIGTGNAQSPPEIYLGWEPQWVMIKCASSSGKPWQVFDVMRGMADKAPNATSQGSRFRINSNDASQDNSSGVKLMSDGFAPSGTGSFNNATGEKYVYVVIRRNDGLVAKPEKVATNIFAIDEGNNASSYPVYESGFPVDFGITKDQDGSPKDWEIASRLTGKSYLRSPTNNQQVDNTSYTWDFPNGWGEQAGEDSDYCSWMWKRYQGFDVQIYKGQLSAVARVHNLGTTPDMIWVKQRLTQGDWVVYHKDMGTYPQDYYLKLNTNDSPISGNQWWKPPTSTHWFTAGGGLNNVSTSYYVAMLFSSIAGISKCGTYSGSSSAFTVDLGFQPRMIIIKCKTSNRNWIMFNTITGWAKETMSDPEDATKYLALNDNGGTTIPAVVSGNNVVCYPVSTGVYFTGIQNSLYGNVNLVGQDYMYFAHA